ncbi:hypothetical protein [Nonomuraea sp. NPDC050643]|uniref:hypothetical protein n=1 Tax=Nonomuraea sp. NPDC050643 TaxID=3155660 RepID=UPI0033E63861
MKLLVIGAAVTAAFEGAGHEITALRRPDAARTGPGAAARRRPAGHRAAVRAGSGSRWWTETWASPPR